MFVEFAIVFSLHFSVFSYVPFHWTSSRLAGRSKADGALKNACQVGTRGKTAVVP